MFFDTKCVATQKSLQPLGEREYKDLGPTVLGTPGSDPSDLE